MKGRNSKEEEDSGSDWDSMSEMDPPKDKKSTPNPSQPIPALLKLKSMTFVDPEVKQSGENPPYDFKPEIKTPSRIAEEKHSKPGRHKKGKSYDPQQNPQKHVTFSENGQDHDKPSMNGNLGGQESDSEDPLYSTVKPKTTNPAGSQSLPRREGERDEGKPKIRKKMPKMSLKSSLKKPQGIDNKGFVDDEQDASVMPPGFRAPLGPILKKNPSGVTHSHEINVAMSPNTSPRRQPTAINQFENAGKYESHHFTSSSMEKSVATREYKQPLILSVGETVLESAGKKPVELTNQALGELFSFVTFPFTCFALFFHHLLRFILLGLIKPLFIDSLILIVEYVLQPLVYGVVQPILSNVHGASVSLSETLVVCIRPITTILNSVRLVEINYTRKYSIEEI